MLDMAPSLAPHNPKYEARAYKGWSQSLYCPSVKFTAAVAKVQFSQSFVLQATSSGPLSAKLYMRQHRRVAGVSLKVCGIRPNLASEGVR